MTSEPGGPRMLVLGAAPHSLGEAVVQVATEGVWAFDKVLTAGITPSADGNGVHEDYRLDVRQVATIKEVLGEVQPDVVVCTVGINDPCSLQGSTHLALTMERAFHVNVIGVMEVLRHFLPTPGSGFWSSRSMGTKKFVVISSNSARIPRRASLAYCASKAALSMAVRVAARELGSAACQVWGYEPGLLAGTPMTQASERYFGSNDPELHLHRMRGMPPGGLAPRWLAHQIVNDIANYAPGLNGVMIPFDAGEQ